jgi:hypothetical protein
MSTSSNVQLTHEQWVKMWSSHQPGATLLSSEADSQLPAMVTLTNLSETEAQDFINYMSSRVYTSNQALSHRATLAEEEKLTGFKRMAEEYVSKIKFLSSKLIN